MYQQWVQHVPAGPHQTQAAPSHVLAPDTLTDSSWSISCPHTMTSGLSTPRPPAHRSSEPEIDVIDGHSFMSFETIDAMLNYTQANERLQTGDPSRVKRMRCSTETAVPPQQSSSAFMSTTLDEFLKEEMLRCPAAGPSPPRDSRIYETGVLKMDGVRKPFADLSKLPHVRDSVAAAPPLSHGVENNPVLQQSEHAAIKRKKTTTLQEFDAAKVSTEQMEKTATRLIHDAEKEIMLLRKPRHISFQMTEPYCNFALKALAGPSAEPAAAAAEQESPNKKGKKKRITGPDVSACSPTKSSRKETDLVAMISRKRDGAKRETHLPVRYQESALIEGDQWICAASFGSDPVSDPVSEKRARKRLQDEQKRLLVLRYPDADTPQSLRKSPEKLMSAFKRKLPQANKSIPMSKLPSPAKRKKLPPGVVTAAAHAAVTVNPVPIVMQSPHMPAQRPAGPGEDLKHLYRELYFECSPERRSYCQKRCVKPRVHKKQAVDEAVAVISRLQKREKQLLYIKTLLSLWHKKLDLCSQVITNKVRIDEPDPNPAKDTVTVVTSVLHAYQNSVCYKISASLEKQLAQNKSAAHQPEPSVSPPDAPARGVNGISMGRHSDEQKDSRLRDEKGAVDANHKNNQAFKADSGKRSKKIGSQSLLLPKKPPIIPAAPNNRANGAESTIRKPAMPNQSAAGDKAACRGSFVDMNEQASDALIDGKPCKKFRWVNNQIVAPDQFIPNSRSESISSATIMPPN